MFDEGGAAIPVPLSCTVMLPLAESLLAIVSVPDCAPSPVGLNVRMALALAPAATVRVAGDTEKGAAVLRPVTFRAAEPLFDIVSVAVWLCPTMTLPNVTLAGVTDICGAAAATPVPLRGTVTLPLAGSLLAIVRVPDC